MFYPRSIRTWIGRKQPKIHARKPRAYQSLRGPTLRIEKGLADAAKNAENDAVFERCDVDVQHPLVVFELPQAVFQSREPGF